MSSTYISLVFTFLFIFTSSKNALSQDFDTTDVNQYLLKVDSLAKSGDYELALSLYEKFTDRFNKEENKLSFFKAHLNKVEILVELGRLNEAEIIALESFDLATDLDEKYLINALNELSLVYLNSSQYSKAKKYMSESIARFKTSEQVDSVNLAKMVSRLGTIQMRLGEYDSALVNNKYSVGIIKRHLGDTSELLNTVYNNMGIVFTYLAEYDEAISYYKRSFNQGDTTANTAKGYDNLAIALTQKGDLDEAQRCLDLALKIYKNLFDENHLLYIRTATNYAAGLADKGEYDLALEYYMESLRKLKSNTTTLGAVDADLAVVYVNIGTALQGKKKDAEAIKYILKSLEIDRKLYGENHPFIAESYNSIGDSYESMKQYDSAELYHRKALNIHTNVFGQYHDNVAKSYGRLALDLHKKNDSTLSFEFYDKAISSLPQASKKEDFNFVKAEILYNRGVVHFQLGHYKAAAGYFQKSLISNTTKFNSTDLFKNPGIDDFLTTKIFLSALLYKSKSLYKIYKETGNNKWLKECTKIAEISDQYVSILRKSYQRYNDKIALGEITEQVYQHFVEVYFEVFSKNGDDESLQQIYYLIERSKSAVLSQSLLLKEARKFGGVPESIIQDEKKLKIDLNFYQSKLNESYGNNADNSRKIYEYKGVIFNTKRKIDSIETIIENRYPQYYEYKYGNRIEPLKMVQKGLSDSEMILEYFEVDSNIYLLAATNKDLEVKRIMDKINIEKSYKYLVEYYQNFDVNTPRSTLNEFKEHSFELYKILLHEALTKAPKGIKHLTLSPPNDYSLIPWDLMISSQEGAGFESLDYLLNKYSVSQTYSINLLTKRHNHSSGKSNGVLAMAPSYSGADLVGSEVGLRNDLRPLEWSKDEVLGIKKYLETDILFSEEATEWAFKERVSGYKIMHLAMHAVVNNEKPMESKLIFSSENDSIDDGQLHIFELLEMEIDADLVVLSACNTGVGRIDAGEGAISLSRAFSFAGIQSLAMSHWPVDDKSTSILMEHFYKFLSEGLTKSEALRQAKLQFIKEAGPNRQHPFFWGAFVVVGDDAPVVNKSDNALWWYLGVGLLLVSLLAVFYRSRKLS